MKTKRYGVHRFPSLYGTPIYVNTKFFAFILGYIRLAFEGGEIRIIDEKTGNHIVL